MWLGLSPPKQEVPTLHRQTRGKPFQLPCDLAGPALQSWCFSRGSSGTSQRGVARDSQAPRLQRIRREYRPPPLPEKVISHFGDNWNGGWYWLRPDLLECRLYPGDGSTPWREIPASIPGWDDHDERWIFVFVGCVSPSASFRPLHLGSLFVMGSLVSAAAIGLTRNNPERWRTPMANPDSESGFGIKIYDSRLALGGLVSAY